MKALGPRSHSVTVYTGREDTLSVTDTYGVKSHEESVKEAGKDRRERERARTEKRGNGTHLVSLFL